MSPKGRTADLRARATALVACAALWAASFAPGSAAVAAEIESARAVETVPAPSAPLSAAALGPAALAPTLAPAPSLAPSLPAAPAALGGHDRPIAAAAVPSLAEAPVPTIAAAAPDDGVPAAAGAAAAADGPVARAGAWLKAAAGRALSPSRARTPAEDIKAGQDARFDGISARPHDEEDAVVAGSRAAAPEALRPRRAGGGDFPRAPSAVESKPVEPKYISEDFLGFRTVRGLTRRPDLGRLPRGADSARIIEQISGQFGLDRGQVLDMARGFGLDESSARERWLAVYDRLQAVNRDHFKRLDSHKYSGFSSFRELTNWSYSPGWRGVGERLLEVHKLFLGAAVRFPYHLFDTFVFGYFRQAASFEFFHSGEDFLGLSKEPDLAKKWLEVSLRRSARAPSALDSLRARDWFRELERWFLTPIARPLATFMVRRLTLAFLSAVAMGLLGAFAPVLPLSFALTSIPLLGPALIWGLNGLPVVVGAVPLFGHVLAPVAAAAAGALARDLVVGPLLNTLILSTLLTFPNSVRDAVAKIRDRHPLTRLTSREWLGAVAGTAVSGAFWAANAKSFLGLATVGAEISGIMTYAGGMDAAVNPVYHAATGGQFHLFEAIGSAIERPKGQSVIPFGGAITWGSTLLFKLQQVSGLHISDAVMGAALTVKSGLGFEDAAHLGETRASAQALVSAAEARPNSKLPFDADLWKGTEANALARIKALAAGAGGLSAEEAAVAARMSQLRAELGDAQARQALLKAKSRPITAAEKAQYDSLMKELSARRDEAYVQAKLAEERDIAKPTAADLSDLQRLKAISDRYGPLLPPPPSGKDGTMDDMAAREASYKALVQRLNGLMSGNPDGAGAAPIAPSLDPAKVRAIADLVDKIERERAQVKGELAQRDATQALLAAANKIRNHALAERRNGQDMLQFHTDFAKLDSVVDLALSLNEINAAEAAIAKMQTLLQQKTAAINSSAQQNQQNLAANNATAAQQQQWQQQAQQAVSLDQASAQSLAGLQTEAATATQNIGQFQTQISNFLAQVNAQDKGQSATAAAEYARRLALLPQAAQWAATGNPNDPSAFSLSGFQADLSEVNSALSQAQAGLAKIPTVPVEFAGVLVVAVPGSAPGQPNPTLSNPTKAQILQVLSQRQAGWQAEMASKQSFLNQVNAMMDPNNTATTTNVFGDVTPVSLPRWLAQTQTDMSAKQSAARQLLSQLDAIATQINKAAGSNIPMLSGMSLTQLQTAIQNYGSQLQAVQFPNDGSVATFQAKMALITAAQDVPQAARAIIQWSQDQATVTAIQSAMTTTLPKVQQSLQALVNMDQAILNDIQADVNFVNTGQGGGQALIDRKTALLQNTIIPTLQNAQQMISGVLIPYQQSSIATYADNSSGSYYTLFTAEQTLLTQTNSLYDTTIPWAIVTQGAPSGNAAAGHASIAAFRQTLQNYMTGYTDSAGYHEGITQYQQDMKDRQCQSGCTRTETVYGEVQPYSLPMKITQYNAEEAQRAGQINTEDAQINQILTQIQTLSNGKYNLQQYMLPVGVGTDAGSVAKINAIVNAGLIPNLGTELQTIAKAAQAAGGSTAISVGAGGSGAVPVGKQPSPTISTNEQIAMLALNAAQRLVPSSIAQPAGAPASYAVARYLYANSVVTAAQTALTSQVPQAVAFLNTASQSLSSAIADTKTDDAYVSSNGTSETAAQVFARKTAIYGQLNGFLQQAAAFYAMKTGWDQQAFGTLNSVQTYYNSLSTIYSNGSTVNQNELGEINTMSQALASTLSGLQATQAKVVSWLSQLDPAQHSALRNVADDVSQIQDKTRAVLEANINWHELEDQLGRSQQIVQADLTKVDDSQQALAALLSNPAVQGSLPPDLVRRVEALHLGQSGDAWAMAAGPDSTQAIVVKKSDFSSFLDALMGMITQNSQNIANQDLSSLKSSLLANPAGISQFIPGASIMQFGDNADGFYLVYNSNFSVPNGLQTGTWATLGNVAHVWGNNISVNSYEFTSPPSPGGQNAPYGDKGVEVQVESLQGQNWVNYLNVDLHRFGFDIPTNNSVGSTLSPSRLMIFDDYAVMLLGDKLYVGLTGYGDVAANQPGNNPYFYGGNLKTSFKLNDVMTLDASQQELFIKDPRAFFENVNLNFTGYDPSLNQNFPITATGDNKYFSRTQIGPTFDINRLLGNDTGDSFTVSLYYANTRGTDDIQQQSLGTTIVKGISIKNDQGKTWLQINNSLTAEAGQQANTLGDQISFTLPDKGVTLSGQGQIIGGARTYYAQLSKKLSDNSSISLGYGSQYIGMPNRLSIGLNTSFTLAQLWQAVADHSHKELQGGRALAGYDKDMADLFGPNAKGASASVQALGQVFAADIGRQLLTQDMGKLTSDIDDLRKAGAFMDNTRTRGMVGFTSGAVDNTTADLAVGGGPAVGTYTEMSLTKTQKKLIDDKTASLYEEGLKLQDRLIALTQQWQSDVVALAEAQWDLRLADYEVKNAPSDAMRADARVRLASALDRYNQALARYNALAGRPANAPSPFAQLNEADLQRLLANVRALVASPDRLKTILGALDPRAIQSALGKTPFNVMNWLPWVDRLTAGFGVQYQDMMNNQVLTVGASVRLPIYDPASKAADHSYVLESRAAEQETEQMYADRAVRLQADLARARAWQAASAAVVPQGPAAAQRLGEAIRAYRNGLIGPDDLRQAFDAWRWYAQTSLEAGANEALAAAAAQIEDPTAAARPLPSGPATITSLADAYRLAAADSHGLAALADRAQAADAMARAQEHRIQKAWLDLNVGVGLTDSGLGWIPQIAITGIPVTPIFGFQFQSEELRELQVDQHDQQKAYYDALTETVKTGLAVQFYQEIVAYKAAQDAVSLYDSRVLPALAAAAASGGADAVRRLDAARVQRAMAEASLEGARAQLNFLLGRAPDSPLDVAVDPGQALSQLQAYLAAHKPVQAQRRVLDARVAVARDVETMVDKNLRIQIWRAEPVSIVVRAFTQLIGALGDKPIYDPDKAAQARIDTLDDERALAAFPAQVADQRQVLSQRLADDETKLQALSGSSDPAAAVTAVELRADMLKDQAALAALSGDPGDGSPGSVRSPAAVPRDWADLQARLGQAEEALAPKAPTAPPSTPAPPISESNSGAYARYDFARQTLGEVPINKGYTEGWIEVRLRDPSTPPDVLLALSRLREQKAERIYQTELSGARLDAGVLAAEFQNDVRLERWAQSRLSAASAPGGEPSAAGEWRALRDAEAKRVAQESARAAALLGLPPAAAPALIALVPQDASAAASPQDLAAGLIAEIRQREVGIIQQTLFSDGGLPQSFGTEDDLMQQIRANTIAERMSYKGFTPVVASGLFQGRNITGVFLEAPDPRDIQKGLESVMSGVLRKQLESDGRMQKLSLQLNLLMTKVRDGERDLQARAAQIQADEADLRARTALAGEPGGAQALALSQQRLARAWADFGAAMVSTKSAFIDLVTELQALGEGSAGTLHPYRAPLSAPAAPSLRPDAAGALVDFWTERLGDASFQAAQDAELAKLGGAVPPGLVQRLDADAHLYRVAIRDADGVRGNDFTAAQRLDLLTRNDEEGKREAVRADVAALVGALGGVGPSSPVGAELLGFFRQQAEQAARDGSLALSDRRALMSELDAAFWGASNPPPAVAAEFQRLEGLQKNLDDAKDALFADYLSAKGDDPTRFVLTDARLDAYLKAEAALDRELESALDSPAFRADPGWATVLDGLYDLRAEVVGADSRAARAAKYGRGMAAIDALIMLERERLRGARWEGRPPQEIDRDAQALQGLIDMRSRWLGGRGDLQPVYAITRVGPDGRRTWDVQGWLTADQYKQWTAAGFIHAVDGREFVNGRDPSSPSAVAGGVRYELIGGVDVAQARQDGTAAALSDNARALALDAALSKSDFALAGTDGSPLKTLDFNAVYGAGGLAAAGRLYYFAADASKTGGLQYAIDPLTAQSLPPEKVVVMAYTGADPPPGHDAFTTLQSLLSSPSAGQFARLVASARGAAELRQARLNAEAASLRRGWVQVKLDSAGFARDAQGRLVQIYTTLDDFQAQWKAFDDAPRDLAAAQSALSAAQAELKAAKSDDEKAQADYERSAPAKAAAQSVDPRAAEAAQAEVAQPDGVDGPQSRAFSAAVRGAQGAPAKVAADKTVDPALAALKKAGDRLKLAQAKLVNARKAVQDAESTLERSKTWTLYRTSDLTLDLDASGDVVAARAPAARGPLALDQAVPGGGPVARRWSGGLAAAVLDASGRAVKLFATGAEVDAAAPSWKLVSYDADRAGGEVDARLPDGTIRTKVRFSHYEDGGLPVLLSERYLIARVDKATSKLASVRHWAVMPYNWGNIVLQIPRGIVQGPLDVVEGRNPEEQHYLGRAYMYKSEGGETEHHGFFRTALGWVDILDLLPDPVTTYYDPSQFPNSVRVGSPILPGQDLTMKSARDPRNGDNVHFGVGAMTRDAAQAAEDLDAARQRTLALFNGGVEDLTLETMRGRGVPELGPDGKPKLDPEGYPIWNDSYQDSQLRVRSGSADAGGGSASSIERRIAQDPQLAAAVNPDAPGGTWVVGEPNGLAVDRVARRVTVIPGASGDAARAAALDGYGARYAAAVAAARAARPGLKADDKAAALAVAAGESARLSALNGEQQAWTRWRPLALRIGVQQEIERRLAAERAKIDSLRSELDWWSRYGARLSDARRGVFYTPAPDGRAASPVAFGVSSFWGWFWLLFSLAGLLSAAWAFWRARAGFLRPAAGSPGVGP